MIKKFAVSAGIVVLVLTAAWYWGSAKDSTKTSKHSVPAAQTPNETIEGSTSGVPSAIADTGHAGTPKIFFPDTAHDFGSVAQGSKVTYTFVVRNTGDAPLKLIKASAGWGCTAAVLTKADIPPGGEGQIEVSFSTGRKKGQQKQSVVVSSNDPENPAVRISVSAFIEVEFDFESYSLDFGRVKAQDTTTKSAFIQILDPEKTRITEITTSSPLVLAKQIEASDSADDQSKIEIEVTLLPGLTPGRFNATVTARSTLESKPEATLRLSGTIVGDVDVNPEMLRFTVNQSLGASNQRTSQLLKITNNSDNKPLHVLGVRDPDDLLELSVRTIEEGQKFELTATLKPEALAKNGLQTGTVVIMTDNPEQKEITVRYNVIVQQW